MGITVSLAQSSVFGFTEIELKISQKSSHSIVGITLEDCETLKQVTLKPTSNRIAFVSTGNISNKTFRAWVKLSNGQSSEWTNRFVVSYKTPTINLKDNQLFENLHSNNFKKSLDMYEKDYLNIAILGAQGSGKSALASTIAWALGSNVRFAGGLRWGNTDSNAPLGNVTFNNITLSTDMKQIPIHNRNIRLIDSFGSFSLHKGAVLEQSVHEKFYPGLLMGNVEYGKNYLDPLNSKVLEEIDLSKYNPENRIQLVIVTLGIQSVIEGEFTKYMTSVGKLVDLCHDHKTKLVFVITKIDEYSSKYLEYSGDTVELSKDREAKIIDNRFDHFAGILESEHFTKAKSKIEAAFRNSCVFPMICYTDSNRVHFTESTELIAKNLTHHFLSVALDVGMEAHFQQ